MEIVTDDLMCGLTGIGEPAGQEVGAGLCLFAMGAVNNNDKAMYQEGANYLQKYVSVAPDGHKYKADAQAILEQLKNEQKVTPQKVPTTTTTRKRGGGSN